MQSPKSPKKKTKKKPKKEKEKEKVDNILFQLPLYVLYLTFIQTTETSVPLRITFCSALPSRLSITLLGHICGPFHNISPIDYFVKCRFLLSWKKIKKKKIQFKSLVSGCNQSRCPKKGWRDWLWVYFLDFLTKEMTSDSNPPFYLMVFKIQESEKESPINLFFF